MAGTLYLVATPIGNLDDISARALKLLTASSAVICEDTRVTKKLLNHYGINKPLLSWHHHSSAGKTEEIIKRLQAGDILSYASDAGTPGIADPGGQLVAAATAQGLKVIPIPGPSAVTTILSVCGFNTQSYIFLGWPPHKKGRQTFFKELKNYSSVIVFFESTHRIIKALTALQEIMPDRQLVVGRELTKMFETIYRGSAAAIIEQLKNSSTKGEFVIVIEGNH
ncbi:16S rRNA (cytidine(1402)-2'-O)-methyltransferase [Patescibacteria group bacterium]|nr:16S rRNA (cytidine(1402)-2'-O)-methyltransferase [Patescibacteria group bacterium]